MAESTLTAAELEEENHALRVRIRELERGLTAEKQRAKVADARMRDLEHDRAAIDLHSADLIGSLAAERAEVTRLKNVLRKDDGVTVDERRVRTERARMEITEKARDIGQLCRRIERLAQRRTI